MAALDWRETLAELVAHRTVSSGDPALDCGNRAAIEALADRLDALGFDCVITPLAGRADKVNLVARLGDADRAAEAGLVFAGHMDTVPCDAEGWDSDPFTLSERGGRLYGLGSCDMKGFIALAAGVAAEYADTALAAPLTLLVSADEECGMDGARALLEAGVSPGRYCVIGEPTGLVPIRRHKGILMERIETLGASGHSSNPALGANAIDGMHLAIAALRALREELIERAPAIGYPVPHATLNLGAIAGGDNANRIPARCRLDVDLRFLPGMTIGALRDELRERVTAALAGHDCEVRFTELFEGTPAFETEADSRLVAACEALTGRSAEAVDFGTEGAFYNRLGMDSVILGPGDIRCAHQPNEHLDLDRIEPMQRILRGLVEQFCRSST
ncbi:acetylornithine deacetylase [Salinisphaera orenii MK-B5]|uniref:Acetylornithine deacetylase n=1 Tax=Salinisphaera orenii MK-B5 TaxID=856730 RepID=A0A423PT02_9GAMM|nr:acetylornithine deacetylase [Salinisphaera orenii]ROO28708.1 acetylornithine deacetylase [Salinisphaera orenii MK-B5]